MPPPTMTTGTSRFVDGPGRKPSRNRWPSLTSPPDDGALDGAGTEASGAVAERPGRGPSRPRPRGRPRGRGGRRGASVPVSPLLLVVPDEGLVVRAGSPRPPLEPCPDRGRRAKRVWARRGTAGLEGVSWAARKVRASRARNPTRRTTGRGRGTAARGSRPPPWCARCTRRTCGP